MEMKTALYTGEPQESWNVGFEDWVVEGLTNNEVAEGQLAIEDGAVASSS